jgi:hypothetical protein
MQGQALAVGCSQIRQGFDTALSRTEGGGSTMIHYLSNDFIIKTVNLLITDYSISTAFVMTVPMVHSQQAQDSMDD